MPSPRPVLISLAVACALGLSGCGNLITRDLTPPQPSSSASSSSGTPATSPLAATTHSATPAASSARATPAASSTAPAPSGSSTPAPPSTVNGILASGLVTPPQSAAIRSGVWALGDSFLLGSARVL